MIDMILQEINNPWANDEPSQRVLDLIDRNPFGQLEEMSFDAAMKWSPYVKQEACSFLKRRKKASVEFRTDEPIPLDASISKNPLQNTARLSFYKDLFPSAIEVHAVLLFVKQLARCFPLFYWGACYTDLKIGEFYDTEDLPWVPSCFMNYLAWVHLISPTGYEPYFERKDLLNMPAYDVQELEDGIIQVMTYKDPLDFASEENRQRIIEITNYLNNLRKDWKRLQ